MNYYRYDDPELNIQYITREFSYGVVCKIHAYSYNAGNSFTINEPEFENGKLISGYVDSFNPETNRIESEEITDIEKMIANVNQLEFMFGVLSEETDYGFIHNYKKELFDKIGVKSELQMFHSMTRDDLRDFCKDNGMDNHFLYRFAVKYENNNVLSHLFCPECNTRDSREYHILDNKKESIVCSNCNHNYEVTFRYGYSVREEKQNESN